VRLPKRLNAISEFSIADLAPLLVIPSPSLSFRRATYCRKYDRSARRAQDENISQQ
jgi:hypothetical protein